MKTRTHKFLRPKLKALFQLLPIGILSSCLFGCSGDQLPSSPLSENTAAAPSSRLPAMTPTPTPGIIDSKIECAAPRHYQRVIQPGEEKFLTCAGTDSTILSFEVPDTGHAIARAQLVFRNNDATQTYYWSAQVTIGDTQASYRHVSYAVGDDLCPLTYTAAKSILGYGHLDQAANHTVKVIGRQGATSCIDGRVGVFSGGVLDIWVEDPRPQCAGKDIDLISSYDIFGVTSPVYQWTTSMTQLLNLSVPTTTNRSHMLSLSSVEGTISNNPNHDCSAEASTLVSQVTANNLGILDTQQSVIPASTGMGHLVLHSSILTPYSTALTTISLLVGSNTGVSTVATGGCCGDGKIGFVKLP